MRSFKVFVYNRLSTKLESVYADGSFKIKTNPFKGEKVVPDSGLVSLGQGPLSFSRLEDALQFRLDAELAIVSKIQIWECEYECDELLATPKYWIGSFSYQSNIDNFISRQKLLRNDSYPAGTICTKQLTLVKRLV